MMSKLFFVACALLVAVASVHCAEFSESEYQSQFNAFMTKYQRSYSTPDELFYRYSVFKSNLDLITAKNKLFEAGERTFKVGITQMADLTNEEYRARYLTFKPSTLSTEGMTNFRKHYPEGRKDAPLSWDWRKVNGVTYVKDQGQCGSVRRGIQSLYIHV